MPIIDPFDFNDFVLESNSENNGSNALGLTSQENNISNNINNEPTVLVENESVVSEPSDELQEEIYGVDYPSAGIEGGASIGRSSWQFREFCSGSYRICSSAIW